LNVDNGTECTVRVSCCTFAIELYPALCVLVNYIYIQMLMCECGQVLVGLFVLREFIYVPLIFSVEQCVVFVLSRDLLLVICHSLTALIVSRCCCPMSSVCSHVQLAVHSVQSHW